MYCNNCGNLLDDSAVVCSRCGQPTGVQPAYQQPAYQQPAYQQPAYQQPAYQDPYAQQPVYQDPYGQPAYAPAAPAKPAMSMGWFKFLIYFSLFASAVLNAINGFMLLTGATYDGGAELVYRMFDGLQGVDSLVGILSLALAALAIFTRFQLAGYKKSGPMLLLAVYAGNAVVNLVYVIGVSAILPELVRNAIDFTSFYSGIVTSIAMIAINAAYFKKRAHLFVK